MSTAAVQAAPGVRVRLAAALRGWVRTDTAQAYRRAGGLVYDQMLAADEIRQQLPLAGHDLTDLTPGGRSQLISTWNAFALQSLGEAFLDAAPADAARLPGFLPKITVAQAVRFFTEVEYWSGQARRAASDRAYDIATQRPIPAPLPQWIESRPCPIEHVKAMLAAGVAMREKIEAGLADLHQVYAHRDSDTTVATLGGLAADADTALAYATAMFTPQVDQPVHEAVEQSVRRAVDAYYLLGQLMAAPTLLHAAPPGAPREPVGLFQPTGYRSSPARHHRGGC